MSSEYYEIEPLLGFIDREMSRPEPAWIVKNLIPSKGLVFLSGRPKADGQKSFLAQGLTLAVANGLPLGPFEPTMQGKVWYIDREGTPYFAANRWESLNLGHGYDREAMANVDYTHLGLFYLTKQVMIDRACRHIEKSRPDLIVIDTLTQSMEGDENTVEGSMKALRGVHQMRDVCGSAVMLVHHVRKSTFTLQNGKPQPDQDVRGSSAIVGAWDMHLAVREYPGTERLLLTGGKVSGNRAYTYQWDIKQDAQEQMKSARIISEEMDYADIEPESADVDPYGSTP